MSVILFYLVLLLIPHCYSLEFFHLLTFSHVHGFLEEIGQGVQHIASRVDNIISFVQEANDRRKIFGEVSILSNEDVSLLFPY